MANQEISWMSYLSEQFGLAENVLRLTIGFLLVYPLFLFYNVSRLRRCPAKMQHVYFILTGICISYWTLGARCVGHSLTCVVVNYVVLKMFGGTFSVTCALFVFQLGYLSAGYFANQTEDYLIDWTVPHCVLCLRLIGIAMDVYDGSLSKESRDKDKKINALKEVPSLLEMTSHAFFLPSYFAGPQHSLTKFRNFIQRNIDNGDMTGSKWYALNRFLFAWVYFAIHTGVGAVASHDFIKSGEFQTMPFLKMSVYYTIWMKGEIAKYVAAFLLADGAVILSGLGYNGTMPDGTILWNGVENMRLQLYETSSRFTDALQSWNIMTNEWCKNYIYKRCRFLNNPCLSHSLTLVFLAVWHGFHSGYFLSFFFQFLTITFEKQFFWMVDNSPIIREMNKYISFQIATKAVGIFYVLFFIPHIRCSFVLLNWDIYYPVLWSTRAMVLVCIGTWPIWKIPVKMLLKPTEPKKGLEKSLKKLEIEKKQS